jgi:hypothetical protein
MGSIQGSNDLKDLITRNPRKEPSYLLARKKEKFPQLS